jgi:lipopolysaccharide transport system ATP-binding protein
MLTAIKVENLSKAYQLGQIGTGTLTRDLERWHARLRGKEDPLWRVGGSQSVGTNEVVWSLKDINFEIKQGESVGVIGRNGAGKSTLLKVLSKVTSPTRGLVSGNGRVASLLEVGTGFHPELSGRENIYLNGAILGMRKKEINRKFEEIVHFAGVERFIDTPVKRYSSGMYVRLAFSVAAHLESEILIVDEVLAVGDAEFQKKCLGKMGDISTAEGRTILFVSHHMASIKAFCKRALVLDQGELKEDTDVHTAVTRYHELAFTNHQAIKRQIQIVNVNISINSIRINGLECSEIELNEDNAYSFQLEINGHAKLPTNIGVECRFYDDYATALAFFSPGHYQGKVNSYQGDFSLTHHISFPAELNETSLYMSLFLTDPGKEYLIKAERILKVNHNGYPMLGGFKFSYQKGAGLLFLREKM